MTTANAGKTTKVRWTAERIPDLTGRTAVVTGASGGIGYQIALQLAAHGAHVVLASRTSTHAPQSIDATAPSGSVEARPLDLASLESVKRFAQTFFEHRNGLDILVNNAGIAGGPRRRTVDGFEAHFGTNHLGHFALTGLLLPALLARQGSRVVTMSTGLAAQANIDFDDIDSRRHYRMTSAYGQSKLANLLFAVEFDRRARAAGADVTSLATHPGVARTKLVANKTADRKFRGAETAVRLVQILFGQPAWKAALPALYQATDPAARAGDYVGTKGHLRGYPAQGKFPPAALDPATAQRLWHVSEQLTSVSYDWRG